MRILVPAAGAFAVAALLACATVSCAQPPAAPSPDSLMLPAAKAGRTRPLIVVVAENRGAETSDFIVPYGVLKDADVAEVRSLSTEAGPVRLTRGLSILADQTLAAFDAAEPAGADLVIVPAQISPKDRALTAWIQAQAGKGATVMSICEGARVLANTGLLKGRAVVSHWSSLPDLAKAYPDTRWTRDLRYVQDGPVISTSGVTAAIPASLALVEAIGGRDTALATARRFGVSGWSAAHRTGDYALTKEDIAGAKRTIAAKDTHETVEIPIDDGVDEVALALRADAWGRSYRTTVLTTRVSRTPVISRHGLTILPDAEAEPGRYVIPNGAEPAAVQLDAAIAAMGVRYGPAASRLATLGMEYDGPPAGD